MARRPVIGEKPVYWVGSSKRDFLEFPEAVKAERGNALGIAQFGGTHPDSKAWKGEGPGIFELVERHDGTACRSIYTVRFRNAVYVLHAFQKKSPKGIKTARGDVELVRQRMAAAKKDYEEHHGKTG